MDAKSVASYLSELCQVDSEFVSLLMRCAVECGPEVATHPIVRTPLEADEEGNYSLTVLDLLNSLLLQHGNDVIAVDTDPNDPVMIAKFTAVRKWWQ